MNQPVLNKSVKIYVFGCQMNKLDSELIKSRLLEAGYSFTEDENEAGIILFITCSVRDHAENRVHSRIGALKAWKKKNKGSILGLMGCMAQKDGEKLIKRHPHLDLVVGTRDFPQIDKLLDSVGNEGVQGAFIDGSEEPSVYRNEKLRPRRFQAFLSIMRGCDAYCSYCIVPFVRGHERSKGLDKIVEESQRLVDDGVLEITLLGQTVNHYNDGKGNRLPQIIRELSLIDGLKRLSFVTSYPSYLDTELIEAMADCKKVSRSLHLPAQSGSDRILKMMKRKYTSGEYRKAVEELKNAAPDMEVASDFIVGFPGETDEDFKETEALMKDIRFHQSFVFKYSPRPGTFAVKKYNDDVPTEVKAERNSRLLSIQKEISLEKNAAWVGRTIEVLVEGESRRDRNRYTGRTIYNQIAVFPADPELVGHIIKVRVESVTSLTLLCDKVVGVVL